MSDGKDNSSGQPNPLVRARNPEPLLSAYLTDGPDVDDGLDLDDDPPPRAQAHNEVSWVGSLPPEALSSSPSDVDLLEAPTQWSSLYSADASNGDAGSRGEASTDDHQSQLDQWRDPAPAPRTWRDSGPSVQDAGQDSSEPRYASWADVLAEVEGRPRGATDLEHDTTGETLTQAAMSVHPETAAEPVDTLDDPYGRKTRGFTARDEKSGGAEHLKRADVVDGAVAPVDVTDEAAVPVRVGQTTTGSSALDASNTTETSAAEVTKVDPAGEESSEDVEPDSGHSLSEQARNWLAELENSSDDDDDDDDDGFNFNFDSLRSRNEDQYKPYFSTVYEFVGEFLIKVYARPVRSQNTSWRWCSQWFCHAEAVSRLDALWKAFESLRLDPATGAAVWWRDFCDPTMYSLSSPEGPFARCSDTTHALPPELPMDTVPEYLLDPNFDPTNDLPQEDEDK